MCNGYSKISQELFDTLKEIYPDRELLYATNGGELRLDNNLSKQSHYMYDFVDTVNKRIIEYHGDMFHGNPEKYSATDKPLAFERLKDVTAYELWEKDKRKQYLAESEGYEYFVVWDSEFVNNKDVTIKKCMQYLSKKRKF